MNIVLFGGESAGVKLFRDLSRSSHGLLGVVAAPTEGKKMGAPTLWSVAYDIGVQAWPATEAKRPQFAYVLRDWECDVVLCVRFPHIVDESVLAAPRLGAYNLHTGPLPRYAGLNVCSWAIFNGEPEHEVNLHEMTTQIDGGRVNFRARFPIESNETGASLTAKSVRYGVPLFFKLLEALSKDKKTLPRIAQDLSQRRYYGREVPDNGVVDWTKTAGYIDRLVRASDFYPFPSPWGRPSTTVADRSIGLIKVTKTQRAAGVRPGLVEADDGSAVLVGCADEWLRVELVEVGDKAVDAAEVIEPGWILGSKKIERPNS